VLEEVHGLLRAVTIALRPKERAVPRAAARVPRPMPGSTKLLSPIIGTARRADDRQPTLKSSPFGRPDTNCRLCPRRVRPPREAGAPVEMAGEGRFCTPVGMEGLENIGSGLIPVSVVPAQAVRHAHISFLGP
jgi:hypothetical protein